MSTTAFARSSTVVTTDISRQRRRALVGLLILGDSLAVGIALIAAYYVRFFSNLPLFDDGNPSPETHLVLSLLILPLWLVTLAALELYDLHQLFGGTNEYARIVNTGAITLFAVVTITYFVPVVRISRGWLVIAWVLTIVLMVLGRFVVRRFVYRQRAHGALTARTLVVGTDEEARAIARQLLATPTCGAHVIGFVGNDHPAGTRLEENLSVVGPVESLAALTASHGIEELIISTPALTREQLIDIFQTFADSDVELRFSSGLYEILTTKVRIKETGYVPLVSLSKVRLDAVESFIKTVVDYAVAGLGLILFSPFMLFFALAIKLDSPGPVFHRRYVLGRQGRVFGAFKFRTMHENGDEILARCPDLKAELLANHKLKEDPRITRLGRFLRRYSVDEIPQFINILRGEMSLIGPRMITPAEADNYGRWRHNLLTVKPGLTGLWQVSGRSDIAYADRVRLDMYYIRNYSLWLDAHIAWQTLPAILKKKGAY